MTLPQAGPTNVPVDHVGSMEERRLLNALEPSDLDSVIQIQFKKTDDLEIWTPVYVSEKNGSIDTGAAQLLSGERKDQTKGRISKPPSKELPQVEPGIQDRKGSEIQTKSSKGGPKNSVSMRDVAEEEKKKQKGKNIAGENLTLAVVPESTQLKPAPTHVMPRFSVIANINEQSDAFIRSRKEAMNRYYNSEPGNS